MFRFCHHSECGGGHAENEDALRLQVHPEDDQVLLAALADGQGGRSDGANAARIACETAVQSATEVAVNILQRPLAWQELLEEADSQVAAESEGYTTLIGFSLDESGVCGASVGDSKLYAWWPERKTEVLELTQGQTKNPPLGSGLIVPRPFRLPLMPGLSLLAVTDGMWKFLGYEELCQALRELEGEDLTTHLRDLLLQRNRVLPDDFSLIWLRWDGSPG